MGTIIDTGPILLELGLESSVTNSQRAVVEAAIRRAEAAVKRYIKYDPVQRNRTEYYPQRDNSRSAQDAIWEANDNTAYTRRVSDASTDDLQLKHIPVRSSTSVRIWIDYDGRFGTQSGAFDSSSEKTEGTDFWPVYDGQDDDGSRVCSDGLIKSIGLWPLEPGSIKVQYTAGYLSDELNGTKDLIDASPIYEACTLEAVRRAKKVFVNKKNILAGFVAGPMTSEKLGDYSYSIDASIANKLFASATGLTSEAKELLSTFVHYGIMGA